MFVFVIFIQYFTVTLALRNYIQKYTYKNSNPLQEMSSSFLTRTARGTPKENVGPDVPTCAYMKLTQSSPFVVLMLQKTSGRFLGMGSIIDKETVLTASSVVKNNMEYPNQLLTLAGRLNPFWGDGSQVYPAKFVFVSDHGVAIVRLDEALTFNKYVKAIRLIKDNPKDYGKEFTPHWGVFGIPRGAWSVPGDLAERTSVYLMKVETEPVKPEDRQKCPPAYPDVDFNASYYTCTMANYSFGWGCQGSPTVAVDKKNKLQQIAVVTDASSANEEKYHIHAKLGPLLRWIKVHSLIGFNEEEDN